MRKLTSLTFTQYDTKWCEAQFRLLKILSLVNGLALWFSTLWLDTFWQSLASSGSRGLILLVAEFYRCVPPRLLGQKRGNYEIIAPPRQQTNMCNPSQKCRPHIHNFATFIWNRRENIRGPDFRSCGRIFKWPLGQLIKMKIYIIASPLFDFMDTGFAEEDIDIWSGGIWYFKW